MLARECTASATGKYVFPVVDVLVEHGGFPGLFTSLRWARLDAPDLS